MGAPVVSPVRSRAEHRAFCALPYALYRDDPLWVPPLRVLERRRWSTRHNASLRSRRVQRFLAWRGGRVVGRIAAIVDEAFAERWLPGSAFFGFFECRNDPEAAAALFAAVEAALREQGRSSLLGPVNLTTHEEVGLLVDGFDTPPRLLTPYNPAWYPALLEACGFQPYRDYRAYLWRPLERRSPVLARLERAAARAEGFFARLRLRPADAERWDAEVALLHGLYSASFAGLWGFVPLSLQEFAERAAGFRPFFRPELLVIAEHDGAAVGFGLVLPDVNEVLARMRGRLLPFGWLRLLRGIKRARSGRFILLGVRPEFAGHGVAPLIASALEAAVRRLELDSVEVSLVADGNRRMRHVIEAFGCEAIKTFRLYEKAILPG